MTPTDSDLTIRPRNDGDLPALAQILAAQQPFSQYPVGWPLPFPVEQFIERESEISGWTAELDGRPVGHVALTRVGNPANDDEAGLFARTWAARAGVGADRLTCVSALFVDHALQGTGIGGQLLAHATELIRADGHIPVLDVVPARGRALAVYRHLGWLEAGRLRPSWLPQDQEDVVLMVLPS